jgi:hypothetical protein
MGGASMTKETNPLDNIHEELKNAMQKEVLLMREILANMNQEEVSLILNDRGSWNSVMQQRYHLIERLSVLRSTRTKATNKLNSVIGKQHNVSQVPLEQILPLGDVGSCEILSLSDQIVSLTDRMNRQNRRNQTLSCQIEHQLSIPRELRHQQPQLQAQNRPKQKNAVATYNTKLS